MPTARDLLLPSVCLVSQAWFFNPMVAASRRVLKDSLTLRMSARHAEFVPQAHMPRVAVSDHLIPLVFRGLLARMASRTKPVLQLLRQIEFVQHV